MNDEIIYLDFDGVIVDSEERLLERKYLAGFTNHFDKSEFDKYFEYTNKNLEEWNFIIRKAESINNSVEIIKELERLKKNIVILTKIHTLYEMRVKVDDIRNHRKINCPIVFVPPKVKKHDIIIPNGNLLIDDSAKNINGWINNGGNGLIFDSKIPKDTNKKIKSLDLLLRK